MKFYIVDDDPDILALLRSVLEKAGHTVVSSDSSQQALKEIPGVRPDCVITDLMMPVMDGFELCRELRRRPDLESMKIIVLSAKSYDFDRRRARELGADGYIVKPIIPATLLASIDEFVSNQMVVTYWGVHGTLPVPGPRTLRRGGNTSCVSIEVGGEPLYIFDCGSGIKQLSDQIMASGTQRFS
ncbi:MAG: response regulator, partial [Betaproteobacteria bacterium]